MCDDRVPGMAMAMRKSDGATRVAGSGAWPNP
jgi:hypothetical protein